MTKVVEGVDNDNNSAAADVSTLSQLLGGVGDDDDDDDDDNACPAPASTSNQKERQGYEHRLLTFRAATYCAKPACLSPLLCARFGWENADTDMLVCSSCSSALAVVLSLRLATNEKLVEAYRQKIVSNHKPSCHFGMTVEQFVRFDDAGGDSDPKEEGDNDDDDKKEHSYDDSELEVPTYMTSVLPEDCLQLMEHPAPSGPLRSCVQELVKCLQIIDTTATAATGTNWKYPKLELPREIMRFRSSVGLLGIGTDDVSVMALAVLGWKPLESLQDSVPVVSLGCPLCFAFMELRLETTHGSESGEEDVEGDGGDTDNGAGTTDDSRPPKRRRLARYCDPLSAHRYYCPYVTGFLKTVLSTPKPVWKTIFERLCREKKSGDGNENEPASEETSAASVAMSEEGNNMDASIGQIRAILRAGIAPKTVDLSGDGAEEQE